MCVIGLDVGVVSPRHKQARQARSGGVGTERQKKLSWSGDLSLPASPSQSSVGEVIQCIDKRHLQSGLQAILHSRQVPM